jgi:hypothetical protein
MRWILYILSFLIPIVGLIAGIYLMTQDDEESKQVGKNCLIAMVINIVLWCLCWVLMTCMGGGLAALTPSTGLLLLLA